MRAWLGAGSLVLGGCGWGQTATVLDSDVAALDDDLIARVESLHARLDAVEDETEWARDRRTALGALADLEEGLTVVGGTVSLDADLSARTVAALEGVTANALRTEALAAGGTRWYDSGELGNATLFTAQPNQTWLVIADGANIRFHSFPAQSWLAYTTNRGGCETEALVAEERAFELRCVANAVRISASEFTPDPAPATQVHWMRLQ